MRPSDIWVTPFSGGESAVKLRAAVLLIMALALLAGCGGQHGWVGAPGILMVRFDTSVETKQDVEAVVSKVRRAELISVTLSDGGGAYTLVGVPEGREARFMEKFEAEASVLIAGPFTGTVD